MSVLSIEVYEPAVEAWVEVDLAEVWPEILNKENEHEVKRVRGERVGRGTALDSVGVRADRG